MQTFCFGLLCLFICYYAGSIVVLIGSFFVNLRRATLFRFRTTALRAIMRPGHLFDSPRVAHDLGSRARPISLIITCLLILFLIPNYFYYLFWWPLTSMSIISLLFYFIPVRYPQHVHRIDLSDTFAQGIFPPAMRSKPSPEKTFAFVDKWSTIMANKDEIYTSSICNTVHQQEVLSICVAFHLFLSITVPSNDSSLVHKVLMFYKKKYGKRRYYDILDLYNDLVVDFERKSALKLLVYKSDASKLVVDWCCFIFYPINHEYYPPKRIPSMKGLADNLKLSSYCPTVLYERIPLTIEFAAEHLYGISEEQFLALQQETAKRFPTDFYSLDL